MKERKGRRREGRWIARESEGGRGRERERKNKGEMEKGIKIEGVGREGATERERGGKVHEKCIFL